MDTLAPARQIAADTVPAPRAATQLDYHRTVSRKLVHKSAVSEVFLTDSERVSSDRFLIAAQWPRDHAVFQSGPGGLTDAMVIVETARQASILVFHEYYGVPLDVPFLVRSMEFRITDLDPLGGCAAGPQEVTLATDIELPSGVRGLRMPVLTRTVVHADGARPCATVTMSGEILDRRIYQRLGRSRGRSAPPDHCPPPVAVRPAAVGRHRAADIVLAAGRPGGRGRWRLRIDQNHPTFFDHGSDHVQAVLMLEALKQCGLLAVADRAPLAGGVLSAMRVGFHAYGEFGSDVELDAREAEPTRAGADCAVAGRGAERLVSAQAVQDGQVITDADLVFRADWRKAPEES
jgi:hypothetical protein